MRVAAAFLACLIAGTLSAFSQTVSKRATVEAARSAVTPVSETVEPVTSPASPLKQVSIEPAETPSATSSAPADAGPAENPPEQAATPPVPEPIPNPPVKPAMKPVEQAATQPTEQPDTYAVPAPAAKTAEPAAAEPEANPEAEPAANAEPKPESKAAPATCPGHPDALGTERVLTISPSEFQMIGSNDYKQTLPLKDHEVVLTFDDGPIPPYTNSVLDTLAANCVEATYFLVGEMAQLRPYLVRRIYNEGHSIGTHTQTHPIPFQRLSMKRVERQVDQGIVSVDNALGDPRALSPFFRIPGFGRTNAIDHFLEKKGLITWSTDIDTDDWKRGTTPSRLIKRTMKRLNNKGRGIILMHDIHPDTALALPRLLKELKEEGYHVVHVVAAGARPKSLPQVAATPIETEKWPNAQTKAAKTDAAKPVRHHHVKRAVAKRSWHYRHYRYRSTHTARADIAKKGASATGLAWQRRQY